MGVPCCFFVQSCIISLGLAENEKMISTSNLIYEELGGNHFDLA
jgi:hypothetical protein